VLFELADLGGIHDARLGVRWDRAQLASEVSNRATALVAAGISADSTLIIAHAASAGFFADLFAAWSLGCTAACIDPGLTAREIATLVGFIEPSAILVAEPTCCAGAGVPTFDLSRCPPSAAAVCTAKLDPARAALILFTSGTTGQPKGVVLSFRALLARVHLNRAAMGGASQMRTLLTLPTSFGHGLIGNALTPLLSGGEIVLHATGLTLAQNLARIIDDYRIGFLSSVPSFWRMALKFSNAPIGDTLKRIHVGSAPLTAALWREIAEWSRAEVVNCYGITELANWVAGASSKVQQPADGLVGKPWGGAIAIKDNSGVIRASGAGELLVKSPCTMTGYFRRPDLTRDAFVDGWYRTGDSAHVDQSGSISLTGRLKDEINRAGRKIQPAELDTLLETHPAIAEACAFGISDAASGEIVAAAVRLRPGREASVPSLRKWCAERLHREAVPERWFIVAELPKDGRGKLSRSSVRQLLTGQS
jgi:acyl-coenzyme A synthetase/AMP-(fatty) acid ligase